MTNVEKISTDFNDGIDRKTLRTLVERFRQLNHGRLERTRSGLSEHQRLFLEALPMLLHVNHPLLPGFISSNSPCGLSQFEPDKDSIRSIKRIARSFEYKLNRAAPKDIYSIFLMGSTGTVAHSGASDMDIWIVHNPALRESQLTELRQKADAISSWADSLSLEVFFFLMDPDKFREGVRNEIGEEDCGSAQHYLLLDEFYRTGLLLAGRYPLWWLVPADKENSYAEFAATLLDRKFIPENEVVDFGGISHIPPGEFIGAGMWQLYKGVDSPYKSVLKILLTEVYASEHPNVEALCLRFKQSVYNGQLDLDELDPYVMVYRRLEEYLIKRNEPSRLDLVRRCLYIKVNIPITKQSLSAERGWRRHLMEKITYQWHWDANELYTLDTRRNWKIYRVLGERKALVNELNYSYRFLSGFARENRSSALINQQDMNILGRKLYAAFERKSGKIEKINPKIAPDISEDFLSLFYCPEDPVTNNASTWVIYPGKYKGVQPNNIEPIKRSRSVIEVLAWCFFNNILDKSTCFILSTEGSDLNDAELEKIVASFERLYPQRHLTAQQHAFTSMARDESIALFINVGTDPMKSLSKLGVHLISDNTDALRYSAQQTNLALSVDQVCITTWKEVISSHFDGENAIIDCVIEFLRNNPPGKGNPTPALTIHCFCATRAEPIAQRIEQLFRAIIDCFYSHPGAENNRYVLEIGTLYFTLQFEGKLPTVKKFTNYGGLIRHLHRPQEAYSHIILDDGALLDSALAAVTQNDIRDVVQVFYLPKNKSVQNGQAEIFVLDEKGSLFNYTTTFNDEKTFIPPMFRFIQSALNRQNSEMSSDDDNDRQCEHIMFFELLPSKNGKPMRAENRVVLRRMDVDKFYNMQAIIEHSPKGEVLYTIYCDHKEFSQLEHGELVFEMAAKYILSMRPSRSRYPVYITDLDLSRSNLHEEKSKNLQICQYLMQKQTIEFRLNEAISRC